jgi:deazaflavin-dependent oxidoreductase (nitroreductase family)
MEDAMATVNDWNQNIINEFRANEGVVGGPFKGATMLLLHHKGRKSGTVRVNPLVYMADGDRYLVFGSKGGAPEHPDWYRNLLANPAATIEVGTEKFDVEASEVTGEERDRLYAQNAAQRPAFAEYQEKTSRTIPVVALRRM